MDRTAIMYTNQRQIEKRNRETMYYVTERLLIVRQRRRERY